jgi:hypothetical protein
MLEMVFMYENHESRCPFMDVTSGPSPCSQLAGLIRQVRPKHSKSHKTSAPHDHGHQAKEIYTVQTLGKPVQVEGQKPAQVHFAAAAKAACASETAEALWGSTDLKKRAAVVIGSRTIAVIDILSQQEIEEVSCGDVIDARVLDVVGTSRFWK